MTLKELALNWIENDRTGEYCHEITIDDAAALIGYMDPDVLESIGEKPTPQAFMDAWNSVVQELSHD